MWEQSDSCQRCHSLNICQPWGKFITFRRGVRVTGTGPGGLTAAVRGFYGDLYRKIGVLAGSGSIGGVLKSSVRALQNCARTLPGSRATKNAVHTFCVVRYPWAVAAGLVGSRWVDFDLNRFWWHVFLQWKVSITRPHAQVIKVVT